MSETNDVNCDVEGILECAGEGRTGEMFTLVVVVVAEAVTVVGEDTYTAFMGPGDGSCDICRIIGFMLIVGWFCFTEIEVTEICWKFEPGARL